MYKGNQLKENILEQGFELITQEGLRFFTVESLVAHLGMSKKTIYQFFPSKEILIEKIFTFTIEMIENNLKQIVESDANPIDKYIKMMDFLVDKISRVSMKKVVEVKNRYPLVWKKIETFHLELRQDFAKIFIEAQENGLARKDIDMNIVATIYTNILNSTFQPEFFLKHNLALVDTVNLFVNIITEGMLTKKGLSAMKKHNKGTK